MSGKHTPGPWRVEFDPYHFDSLSSVRGGVREKRMGLSEELIVEVGGWSRDQESNARLIAAAPELYEIAQAVVDAITADESLHGALLFGIAHRARAAIAKATGETT